MLKYNEIIEDIRDNGGFKTNNREDSYYRIYKTKGSKPIQVRISNHGTHLWSWLDRKYDPSYSINICIVFSQDGTCKSNTVVNMDIKNSELKNVEQYKSFDVIQYVYNCNLLDISDVRKINIAIQSIYKEKGYKDPLINSQKQAKIYKLTSNNKNI